LSLVWIGDISPSESTERRLSLWEITKKQGNKKMFLIKQKVTGQMSQVKRLKKLTRTLTAPVSGNNEKEKRGVKVLLLTLAPALDSRAEALQALNLRQAIGKNQLRLRSQELVAGMALSTAKNQS
jgi:hypothetical protein